MGLEQLSLATAAVEGGDDWSRAARLPRWTRQEILVLIQGKRVAESRVRRGRTVQVEPKWASVASYCTLHGVNRGPVQCRKRWSNLAGDYKKIKEWECQIKDESESFWAMRNDSRREKKLPGFFDKEVFDILDGAPVLSLPPPKEDLSLEDGLFSDHDDGGGTPHRDIPLAIPAPTPISEKQYQPIPVSSQDQGTSTEKQAGSALEVGCGPRDGRKRKRIARDGDEEAMGVQCKMIELMERNGKMVSSQVEVQNRNIEMEREQRREHEKSLVAVLNKLADALGRIAQRL